MTIRRRYLWLLLLAMLLLSSQYGLHGDEADNLLGGYRIAHGATLYTGYWSHHMPLPYYLAAGLAFVAGHDIILLRLAFAVVLWGYWLGIAQLLPNGVQRKRVVYIALAVAVVSPLIHAQMLMAETLAGYALIGVVVLWTECPAGWHPQRNTLILWTLLAVMVLSSLIYGYLAFALVLLGSWRYRDYRGAWVFSGGIIALATVLCLSLIGINPLIDHAYRYNAEVYAPYFGEPTSITGLLSGFAHYGQALVTRPDNPIVYAWIAGTLLALYAAVWWRRWWKAGFIVAITLLTFYPLYGSFRMKPHLTAHYLVAIPLLIEGRRWLPYRYRPLQNGPIGAILLIAGPIAIAVYIAVGLAIGQGRSLLDTPNPLRLQAQETVWIAPQNTYGQLQLADHLDNRFGFFLPWMASESDGAVQGLTQDPPTAILVDLDWRGYHFAEYAPTLWAWINTHYTERNGVYWHTTRAMQNKENDDG